MKFTRISYETMNTDRQKWNQTHGFTIAILIFCLIPLDIVGGTADKQSTSMDENEEYAGKIDICIPIYHNRGKRYKLL